MCIYLHVAECDKWGIKMSIEEGKEKYGVSGIEMINRIPTPASSKQLFQAMDYYGAVMAYLWALPAVGLKGWENANVDMGADPKLDGQICLYTGYVGAGGVLTPNTAVTYVISFVDTNVYGPAVWEYPPGQTAGYVGDQWQRPVLDTGVAGPDAGKGVKLLIVGPDQDVPEHDDSYTVVQSPTNVVWLGTRNMADFGPKHDLINAAFDSYPYSKPEFAGRAKLRKEQDVFKQYHPHGMAYWENVNAIIQREKMAERDQFFYAILANLGIEKGEPFEPTAEQEELLVEAERVGYMMSVNNTFKKRFEGAQFYEGKRWLSPLVNSPDQIRPAYGELFERASFFHEALGSTYAMKMTGPGPGSAYMAQYYDGDGVGFDGGKTYKLEVPGNPPVDQFWALTVYDSHTRTLIENERQLAEINSLNDMVQNPDGSTTIYIGPQAPAGMENNWIQTSEGQTWFTYFRFYGPRLPYFDKSWVLNDIELA